MLFANILESRAFRKPNDVDKYSLKELNEILFLHLLCLPVLHNNIRKYVDDTLLYPAFDGLRFSATDLCNLISTVKHADRYLDERPPALPILELKRYMRELAKGQISKQFSRSLFYKLERTLRINDGQLSILRRQLVDYDGFDSMEHLNAVKLLYKLIKRTSYNSDLISKLHEHLEKIDG